MTLHFSARTLLFLVLLNCFSLFHTSALYAETLQKSALQVAQELRQHLRELSSLSFHFNQRTRGQMSGRPRQATGQAYLAKNESGAKMRWDYQTPDRQVIISDGKELSMYFENLNQMIIAPAESLQQDITYSFFTGDDDIEDDFIVSSGLQETEKRNELAQFDVIKLVPKAPTSQIQSIRIWVTKLSQIKRIEIQDTFDTLTLLNISQIQENAQIVDGIPVNDSFFTFTPPQGTEIIRQ